MTAMNAASTTGATLRWTTLISMLFALAWFGNIGYRKLVKADEGRYAEIPREMVASGDWLTPRMNGFKYFEKPALQYWATAAAFSLFGFQDWAARLWPALTGFLAVLMLLWLGPRICGPPPPLPAHEPTAGQAGAIVLGSMALHVFSGHFLTLDMGVAFFMSAAVLAVAMAQRDEFDNESGRAARRRWMLAGWAAMALAVLSKGLIGLVLPVAAVGAYILLARDWRMLTRLHLLSGGALFLLIATPWFVAVSLANKEFFQFFFIQEHFQRFLTKAHGRYQPWWYFILVLAIGATPWLLSALAGFWSAWRRVPGRRFQPARFLAVWCTVVFVFFSASSSKLGSYILPLIPALALLAGLQLQRTSRALLLAQSLLGAGLGVAAWFLASRITGFAEPVLPKAMLAGYVPWVAGAGALLAAAGIAAALLAWQHRVLASMLVLAVGGMGFTQLAGSGHEVLSPLYSAYDVAQKIRPRLKPGTRVYTVNTFDHTLPYYLGRTVTMVSYKDELTVAIGWEPHKFLPDMPAFERAWLADSDAYAMFAPRDFDALSAELRGTMRIIQRNPRRVMVERIAQAGPAEPRQ
ncbi:MAG: glycosyltransferase family 39 protein [Betaproteobacteria bacterium]|nr:glycosyltransferase family 39 protein [Betaproteobacteria bacterium]